MKLKYLFMMGLVPSISGISAISANKSENNQEYAEKKEFILHSEIMRIKRLANKDTKYLWSKEITDIFNRKFFLIVTKNATSIVDLETTITIEMRFNEIDIDKSKEIIYAHQLGFLIKKDNDYYSIDLEKQISIDELKTNLEPIELPSDNNFIKEEIRKRNIEISTSSNERSVFSSYEFPKLDYVGKNKFNVSHVVDHAWWFATRKNDEEAGYLDLKFEDKPKVGICEYVALSELLLYNHLFVDSSIFDSLTWDKYIKNNRYDDDLEHSSPIFKGLNYFSSAEEKRNSLPYKLFEAADKSLNLWTPSYYWPATNSIIKGESVNKWNLDGKYGGYYRAWEYILKGVPVILSSAMMWHDTNHAYIMYGYDSNSDMFLGSQCFGRSDSNTVLYSYWINAWGSYFFTIESKNNNKKLDKLFTYKGSKYTGKEITKMIENN